MLILLSASGITAVAAKGDILRSQLGSQVSAGGSRRADADMAEQQLRGRAAGDATFEALPISGLKNVCYTCQTYI